LQVANGQEFARQYQTETDKDEYGDDEQAQGLAVCQGTAAERFAGACLFHMCYLSLCF
jgi:hypothetical protein